MNLQSNPATLPLDETTYREFLHQSLNGARKEEEPDIAERRVRVLYHRWGGVIRGKHANLHVFYLMNFDRDQMQKKLSERRKKDDIFSREEGEFIYDEQKSAFLLRHYKPLDGVRFLNLWTMPLGSALDQAERSRSMGTRTVLVDTAYVTKTATDPRLVEFYILDVDAVMRSKNGVKQEPPLISFSISDNYAWWTFGETARGYRQADRRKR